MTPEEVIESLVDKFDNANDIIANYLHHKSLDLDDCLIMGSCGVVYLQQTEIEKKHPNTCKYAGTPDSPTRFRH